MNKELKYKDFKDMSLDDDIGRTIHIVRSCTPEVLVDQEEKEYQIWLDGVCYFFPELKIYAFEGMSDLYYEEVKDYMPDFEVVIFYDSETGKEVYYECNEELSECLFNYCTEIGQPRTVEEIENLRCDFIPTGDSFLRYKVLKGNAIQEDYTSRGV